MSVDFKSEDEVKDYIKNLGTEYRFGCYKEKNPEACHLLGDYLEAISKDFEKSARVYKTNCDDLKFPRSCLKTGNNYMSGRGGWQKSTDKGLEYYQRGCDLGSYECCFRAGFLNVAKSKAPEPSKTFLKGLSLLTKACNADHSDSCYHLSSLYMDGNSTIGDDLAKDMPKAFQTAVKACDLGNIFACVNVSIMYKRGEGVEKSQEKSDKYKTMALEKKKEMEARQLTFQEGMKPA